MRRVRGALAAMAVLVVAACASGQPGDIPSPPADPDPPVEKVEAAEKVEQGVVIFEDRVPGDGLLFVSDFRAGDASFDAEPTAVRATLTLRPDGCLVAVVDGVEHTPAWPDHTLFAGREIVTVELPDGPSLRVGQSFTAHAVIGAAPAPGAQDDDDLYVVPEVVGPHLAACAVAGQPIAFVDVISVAPGS